MIALDDSTMRLFVFSSCFSFVRTRPAWLMPLCAMMYLSGCALPARQTAAAIPSQALGNVEFYTFELANELFAGIQPVKQATYAVSGFVSADRLESSREQHPLMLLGQQLQQGMLTEASKRGFQTYEMTLARDLVMGEYFDKILTRNIEQLNNSVGIDYVITGTMLMQEGGAIVNARLINVRNNHVLSAATRYFPGDLFWQPEQVTTRDGRLYRLKPL